MSESTPVRDRAIELLARIPASEAEGRALAIHEFVLRLVSDSLFRFEREVEPDFPVILVSNDRHGIQLFSDNTPPKPPKFTWPLPLPSERENLTHLFPAGSTLRNADSRLREALITAHYGAGGLFVIPGGFICVAKMEQVDTARSPVPDPYRWLPTRVPPQNLTDYLIQLFLNRPGIFRLVVFAVTNDLKIEPTAKLTEAQARMFYLEGADDPNLIPNIPMGTRQVYAFIYEFEKKSDGEVISNIPSPVNAQLQLERAGLWTVLAAAP